MIIGIGIDAVEIARFAEWHNKPLPSLKRIFSEAEIAYCLQHAAKSAERFAARFALREALYKTIHAIPELHNTPFLTLMRAISISKNVRGAPCIALNWHTLHVATPPSIVWHASLTHTAHIAIASVVAEQKR